MSGSGIKRIWMQPEIKEINQIRLHNTVLLLIIKRVSRPGGLTFHFRIKMQKVQHRYPYRYLENDDLDCESVTHYFMLKQIYNPFQGNFQLKNKY